MEGRERGGGTERRDPKYCSKKEKTHVRNSIEKCFAKSIQKFDVSKFCIPPSPAAVL